MIMDLIDFNKLKPLHLLAFCFCALCVAVTITAIGITLVNPPLNTSVKESLCDCHVKQTENGPTDSNKTEQLVSPSGDILCGPQGTL